MARTDRPRLLHALIPTVLNRRTVEQRALGETGERRRSVDLREVVPNVPVARSQQGDVSRSRGGATCGYPDQMGAMRGLDTRFAIGSTRDTCLP